MITTADKKNNKKATQSSYLLESDDEELSNFDLNLSKNRKSWFTKANEKQLNIREVIHLMD